MLSLSSESTRSLRTCLKCNSGTGNSFTYDIIPESFDDVQIIPNPPPQCHFNIYLCQICESNSHYGYECLQRVPLVYEPKPCYAQNFSDNDYSHGLPGVNPLIDHHCCYKYGNSLKDFFFINALASFVGTVFMGLPEADHCQPPQYTVNRPIFNAHNDLLNSQNKLMEQMTSMCEMVEKQIEEDQAANARYWKIPACYDDDNDYNFAITPNEPVNSLKMGDEHLDTVLAMESDEFIKSSIENLVPNPSESESENECDVPACFTTFSNILFDADYDFYSSDDQSLSNEDFPKEIYSNPLFDEEIISMKIDPHHFNAESDLIESLLNHDSSITSSSLKIDSLFDEFAGELTLLKSILPGIVNLIVILRMKFVLPRDFCMITHLLDSDSLMEEIGLSFTSDDPMPSGIEEDDYDSERDIPILEELLDNYSLSLPENESFHFDIPSSSRPPAKPQEF
nr:hypothetical protein [Tanacetum cinerariifolium]